MQQINKRETESTAYSQLEAEITMRQVDIKNLQEAIAKYFLDVVIVVAVILIVI